MYIFLKKIQNIERGDNLKKIKKILINLLVIMLFTVCGLFVENIFKKSNKKYSSITYAKSTNSTSDVQLMARAINGEARGEPYEGQVAVGAVILNRVKSSQFPNTIAGVIYQKGAFTAVSDGQINLTPNQTAYNAARDALNGWDPSYGSIYYFNPSTATNAWIWSRPHVVTIGKHRFCK